MPFTHQGDVNVTAHPSFPNLYGYGNLAVTGSAAIDGNLVVTGSVTASSIGTLDQSVSAIKTADQIIATGTETQLTGWNVSDPFRYNTGSCFDLTTGQWDCLVSPGKYEFNLHCVWDNTTSTVGVRQVRALFNGVTEITSDRAQPYPDTNIFVTQRLHCDVYLTVGQYITFVCLQDSGINVAVDARTTLTVKRI